MSSDPNVSNPEPVRPDESKGLEGSAEASATGTRRKRRIVDTDVELCVYGLEDADGTLGVSDIRIQDALHGLAIWISGHKFVLAVVSRERTVSKIERFFFEDELYHE